MSASGALSIMAKSKRKKHRDSFDGNDYGTEERHLHGKLSRSYDVDPEGGRFVHHAKETIECVLDLLLAMGHLGGDESDRTRRYTAGMWLRGLYARCQFLQTVTADYAGVDAGGEISDQEADRLRWNRNCYREALSVAGGGAVATILRNVCCLDEAPTKFQHPILRDGLDAVAKHRGIE